MPQRSSPASRYARVQPGLSGPRRAARSWAAMKSASLTIAGWAGRAEMTQPSGRFHRCDRPVPQPGVRRVDQITSRCAAGSTPAAPCNAGCPGWPGPCAASTRCRCDAGCVPGQQLTGTGRAASLRARAILAMLCPASRCREDPRHLRRRLGIGLQPARPPAPRRMGPVRMRAGVGEPVPVGRPAAEVAALFSGLRGHRGADPDPGAGDLPLGLQPERHHRLLVILGTELDPATDLRSPQLDPVVLEQRRHRRELAPAERPLILPDHHRIPPAARRGSVSAETAAFDGTAFGEAAFGGAAWAMLSMKASWLLSSMSW